MFVKNISSISADQINTSNNHVNVPVNNQQQSSQQLHTNTNNVNLLENSYTSPDLINTTTG